MDKLKALVEKIEIIRNDTNAYGFDDDNKTIAEAFELVSDMLGKNNSSQGEKGEKGEKGDKGERGEKGEKGEKGEAGANGRDGINGTNGLNGADGKDGENGRDGTSITAVKVANEDEAKALSNLNPNNLYYWV